MRKTAITLIAASLALSATSAFAADLWPFHRDHGRSVAPQPPGPPGQRGIADLIYLGAQAMADRAGLLAHDRPVVVSTVVSIDDLNQSSTFGRLASELVADRLAQRGYMVRDLTYMRALTVEPHTGELVLSRDATKLLASANAQAVVAGTYAVGGTEIYLSLRLLRADDGQLLSSVDLVLPYDHNMEELIGQPARWTSHEGPQAPIAPADYHGERGEN